MTAVMLDADGTAVGGEGDCFAVALALVQHSDELCFALGLRSATRHVYLVHGVPLGTGGDAAGLRYWHAWVEIGEPDDLDALFLDYSNGRRFQLTKRRAYETGALDPADLLRYTRRQARSWANRTGIAGPWEPRPRQPR